VSVVKDRAIRGPAWTIPGIVERHIREVQRALADIQISDVERVVDLILGAYSRGSHVYIIGNGGSASTASHFACDLSKSTVVQDRPRLRVSSLTDNVALLTAWANDASYERVFAEQLANLVEPGDVLLSISASGNSPNLLAAVDAARHSGAVTVAFVGCTGGDLLSTVDAAVHVTSHDYGVVEDCHLVLEHAVTASTRGALLG